MADELDPQATAADMLYEPDIDAAVAAKIRKPFLPGIARGSDPEVEARRELAARLGLTVAAPYASALYGLREGADTGDFTNAATSAAAAALPPLKAAGLLWGLGALPSTSTQSQAEDNPHAAAAINQNTELVPMSPDDAARAQAAELESLRQSKAAVPVPTPVTRTNMGTLGGRGNYGARAAAKSADAADATRYEREMGEYRNTLQGYDDKIAALPAKYQQSIKLWNELPFAERSRWAMYAAPAAAAVTGAGTAYGIQRAMTAGANRFANRWQGVIDQGNAALQKGAKTDATKAALQNRVRPLVNQAQAMANDVPKAKIPWWGLGLIGAEGLAASDFPQEVDLQQPAGTKAKESALETFDTPEGWATQALRALLGTAGAYSGSKFAGRNAEAMPTSQAEALAKAYAQRFGRRR
jgi:hypothetical protein